MFTEAFVTLRPLDDADIRPMAMLLNNPRITCNLRDLIPFPYTKNDAAFFINLNKTQRPVCVFAIVYQDHFCGVIGMVPQLDVYRKSAEVGYWLGEPFWNKGILTTALKLISAYGFSLGYIRLFAGVFEHNIPSMKVLEKNGYQKEGIFEQSIFKNGQVWNEHRYAKTSAGLPPASTTQ
ncbi:MAG: GNAT family protein [Chitinophagaceae bacterium]